jgi:ferritin-like metal-binding protein YciE
MSIASLKDLYIDELGDLYDAETQAIRALARLSEAARAPELKEALSRHSDESRLHLERLQLIFTHWGTKIPLRRCAGVAGIVQEADERVTEPATADTRDAAIIGAAQRIEHYEIAAYGCARSYARRLNRPDEARLLQETLDEEGRADHRLTEIAEAHVNDDARLESDFAGIESEQPLRPLRPLRYVALDERMSRDSLEVRNDADDRLGTLDGLVVDATSGAPRYIVVDADGLFSWRRSLLPMTIVRFDRSAHLLRVPLDKDIASRYPAFDRNEFDRMDDDAVRKYEARLIGFFPKEDAALSVPKHGEGELPEWMVKSAGLTGTAVDPFADPSVRRRENEEPTRDLTDRSEQVVARGGDEPASVDPDDAPTPPHGEKLR